MIRSRRVASPNVNCSLSPVVGVSHSAQCLAFDLSSACVRRRERESQKRSRSHSAPALSSAAWSLS